MATRKGFVRNYSIDEESRPARAEASRVRAKPLTRTRLEDLKARLQTAYTARLAGQHALTDNERIWLQLGHEHGIADMMRVLEAAGLKVDER